MSVCRMCRMLTCATKNECERVPMEGRESVRNEAVGVSIMRRVRGTLSSILGLITASYQRKLPSRKEAAAHYCARNRV